MIENRRQRGTLVPASGEGKAVDMRATTAGDNRRPLAGFEELLFGGGGRLSAARCPSWPKTSIDGVQVRAAEDSR